MAFEPLDPQQDGTVPPVNPTGVTLDMSTFRPSRGGGVQPTPTPAPVQQPQQQSPIDFINKSAQPLVPGQTVAPVNPTGVTLDMSTYRPSSGGLTGTDAPPTHRDPHSIVIKDSDNPLMKGVKAVGGTLEGIGEGVFGTVEGLDKIGHKVLGMAGIDAGDISPTLKDLAGDDPTIDNGSWHSPQNIGKIAEMAGEFYLGDAAIKGLSQASGFTKAAKLMEIVEDHPILARIIGNGLAAGTTGAGQAFVKTGGDPQAAITGGALGGVLGAAAPEVAGAATSLLGKGATALGTSLGEDSGLGAWLGRVGSKLNPEVPVPTAEDAATKQASRFTGVEPGSAPESPQTVEAYKGAVADQFHNDVLDSAKNAVQDVTQPTASPDGSQPQPIQFEEPASPRDYMGAAARTVYQSAKSDFAALDEASGGQWQRFDNQIRNLTDQMSDTEGVDEAAYAKAAAQRDAVIAAKDSAMQQLVAEGKVDPAIAERAQTSYKRAMALQDVDKAVKFSVDRAPAPDGQSTDTINPEKLSRRLQKLNDIPINGGASRLEQALGADGAADLINKTDEAAFYSTAPQEDATGQAYLKSILQKNILNSKGVGSYNWEGVLSDLNKSEGNLSPEELSKSKALVQGKIKADAVKSVIKTVAPGIVKLGLGGGVLYELYHHLAN